MALIECKKCKLVISSDDTNCSKCGAKVKKSKSAKLLAIIIVGVGIVVALANSNDPQKPRIEETSAESQEINQLTFKIKTAQYVKNLKKMIDQMKGYPDFNFTQLKTSGEVNDVAVIKLNKLHQVILVLDKKTADIKSLSYIAGGDGTESSGLDIIIISGLVLNAINNDNHKDGGDFSKKLFSLWGKNKNSPDQVFFIKNNRKYTFQPASADLPAMFFAELAKK